MVVRLVTALAAVALLAGCSTEEGMRAQELLQRAEAAQAQLGSATFDGSVGVSADGESFRMLFEGATSKEGEWLSMRTQGAPDGDVRMQVVVRGGRAWLNLDGRWQATPVPRAADSGGTLSAAAFRQLARHVEDVRVTEHQLVRGKPVTTIAGEIDTEGMLEALLDLGSFAEGFSLDFSELGIDIGDIHAVLTIDEQTQLLDSALVTLALAAEGESIEVELRYRLSSVNERVSLPSPPG
jgi:hypothetical protein